MRRRRKTEMENTQNRALKYKVKGTRYKVKEEEEEKNLKNH